MTGHRAVATIAALAPSLMAAGFVLTGFVHNAVPLDALWRPTIVAVVVAVVVQAVGIVTLGSLRGSFWAFVVVAALTGAFVVAGASVLAFTLFGVVSRTPAVRDRLAGLLAAAVAAALAIVPAAQGAAAGAFEWTPIRVAAPDVGDLRAGPSVHLLMLDGYPRRDLLAELGFDNGPFLAAMDERGFEDYPASRSNYDRTPFSLLSVLSLQHLDDIEEMPEPGAADPRPTQERIAGRALLGVPLFELLERAGYRTRIVAAPVVHVPLGGAAVIERPSTATNFELDTLQRTPLAAPMELIGFGMGQARAHVTDALERFGDPPDIGPTFSLTHVMAPHAPFSFASDGSAASAPPCYPAACAIFDGEMDKLRWSEEEHWARMTAHLEHLNALVIEAVDDLLADDPDAVVVIFSDHGMLVDGEQDNMHRNLLLARTPGHADLFGAEPTLVNVVPALLNAYAGARAPALADDLFRSGTDPWLDVMPYRSSSAQP